MFVKPEGTWFPNFLILENFVNQENSMMPQDFENPIENHRNVEAFNEPVIYYKRDILPYPHEDW